MFAVHTPEIETLLPEFVLGILEGEDRTRVESHLAECSVCAAAHRQLVRDLKTAGRPAIPAGYFHTLVPSIHDRLERPRTPRRLFGVVTARVALPLASFALAVFLLVRLSPAPIAGTVNPLAPVLESSTPEELVDAMADVSASGTLAMDGTSGFAPFVITERTQTRIVAQALAQNAEVPSAVFGLDAPDAGMNGMDETEIDNLLQRLGERTIL